MIAWLDLYFPLWRDMLGLQLRVKRGRRVEMETDDFGITWYEVKNERE